MKKIVLIILLVAFCGSYVFADESMSPLALAAVHAEQDRAEFTDPGWGWMAFGATTLLSPVMGGLTIGAAYTMEPDVSIPARRLMEAEDLLENDKELLSYKYAYEDTAADYIKQDRVKRTWIGAGIGLGLELLAVGVIVGASLYFQGQSLTSSYY